MFGSTSDVGPWVLNDPSQCPLGAQPILTGERVFQIDGQYFSQTKSSGRLSARSDCKRRVIRSARRYIDVHHRESSHAASTRTSRVFQSSYLVTLTRFQRAC
jgi:hypothetical protein